MSRGLLWITRGLNRGPWDSYGLWREDTQLGQGEQAKSLLYRMCTERHRDATVCVVPLKYREQQWKAQL